MCVPKKKKKNFIMTVYWNHSSFIDLYFHISFAKSLQRYKPCKKFKSIIRTFW